MASRCQRAPKIGINGRYVKCIIPWNISCGLLHLLRLRPHFVDVADVQERLLGQIVGFAVADLLEAAERVGELGVLALLAGELLGDEERLAKNRSILRARLTISLSSSLSSSTPRIAMMSCRSR